LSSVSITTMRQMLGSTFMPGPKGWPLPPLARIQAIFVRAPVICRIFEATLCSAIAAPAMQPRTITTTSPTPSRRMHFMDMTGLLEFSVLRTGRAPARHFKVEHPPRAGHTG